MNMTYPDFITITIVAIITAATFMILKKTMEYKPKEKGNKNSKRKQYTCGENIDPLLLETAQDTFYTGFIKSFKLDNLKKLHTGSLTEYLHWIFAGMIIILTIMVLTW